MEAAMADQEAIIRRFDLRIQTEQLIASDRRGAGRPVQHLGDFEREVDSATQMVVQGLRRVRQILDAYTS
jgi:hypothetical protein